MSKAKTHRIESDSLGEISVPRDAAWGSQTQHAVENFPISGVNINHYPELIVALAQIKASCARANAELGVLDNDRAAIIEGICAEIASGQHHDQFVVDVMQGGAGTSTNMNANEVIANLGLKRLGHNFGEYSHLHPNDHVNRSQSTNDVYPTAIRLAVLARTEPLIQAMRELCDAFQRKAGEFGHVKKVGRTQLQDAVPMTLGDEFHGFETTIREDIDRLNDISKLLTEINLGGTAIGTGINAPEGFAECADRHLSTLTGLPLKSATDLIEASSDLGALVAYSGILKRIAVKLSKICNDLRMLSSGPRAGIGEIILPAVQAGSSIMPGKINPVIPEVVNQVCFQVIGNDVTITFAAEAGQLQLNAMEPVILHKIMESMGSLRQAMHVLTSRCVDGIEADEDRCQALLGNSLIYATELAPIIGYEAASKLAKYAKAHGLDLVSSAPKALSEEASELSIAHLTKKA
jgi:aspartate ammonia-lyase